MTKSATREAADEVSAPIASPVFTGNVGIGTSSPSTALDVSGAAGITSFTGTTKLGVVSKGSTAATDYVGYDFIGNSQTNPVARIAALTTGGGSTLSFGTSNSYGSGITNTAMTIDNAGDVALSGGVYLGGTATANKLDDYEEGTWTPVVQGAAGNPSSVTFHTAPSGRYTKIGRQVTIAFYLHINTATGGSGNFQLHGVPFTAASGNGGFSGAVSLYYADASLSDPVLKIDTSTFLSIICASGTGGYFSDVTWASAQLSAFATGTAMSGTLTYFV